MTDNQQDTPGVESAEKAADQVALLVFFADLKHATVGDVRTAALQVIEQRDAAIRAAANQQLAALLERVAARDATIARLREALEVVTDVAHSRQRTEWRNDYEQEAIDAAYAVLAATAQPESERETGG